MATPAHGQTPVESASGERTHEGNDQAVTRINSSDLFRQKREVEIAHGGRIYRLRLTQLNKLILTA
jgi:hemin uptake protein HemP